MMILIFVIWFIALALTVWGTLITLRQARTSPPHLDAPFNLYPVSILKPLKGVDAGLRENLETFFNLDYPDYELLFSVPSAADPAYVVAKRLIAQYPSVKARIFVGEANIGPNPKVNNMLAAYESATNDWILISDSNVRVGRAYLKRMVAHLEPGVGMVTAVVAGREAKGLGGKLEATFLNTFYARGMRVADRFGKPCVVGKSMLFQRSTAKRFGGIRNLARYLAEDYMAGEAMRRLGLKVIIMNDPVVQIIGEYSLTSFWQRHIRWGRIRKAQAPIAFFFEPLTGCFVSGALGAWSAAQLFNVAPSNMLAAHLAIWSFCDLLLMMQFSRQSHGMMPIWWLLRELTAVPLWLNIASGKTVNWRGKKLTLQSGGILES